MVNASPGRFDAILCEVQRCLYSKEQTVAVDSPNLIVYRIGQCTVRQYHNRRGLQGHQLDSVGRKIFSLIFFVQNECCWHVISCESLTVGVQ